MVSKFWFIWLCYLSLKRLKNSKFVPYGCHYIQWLVYFLPHFSVWFIIRGGFANQEHSIMARVRYTFYIVFFIKNQLQLQNGSELISCQKSPTGEFRCNCAQQTEVKCCKKTIDCPFFWRVLQIIDCFENDVHV